MRWLRAAALIVSWMTVLPLPVRGTVDRPMAGRAITLLPVAGTVVGALCTGLAWSLTVAGAPTLLTAGIVVTGVALVTRGMHLDGLADTVDALASYAPADKAREIMRDGPVGPLGAAAMGLASLVEFAALVELVEARSWWAIAAVGVISRSVAVLLCRRSVHASPGGGFAPLVAATQGPVAVGVACVCAVSAGAVAGYTRAGSGGAIAAAALVCVALVVAVLFGRHVQRRLGGLSGDVLGAVIAGAAVFAAAGLAVVGA